MRWPPSITAFVAATVLLGQACRTPPSSLLHPGSPNDEQIRTVIEMPAAGSWWSHLKRDLQADIQRFYADRNGAPAWATSQNSSKVDEALKALANVQDDGLDPEKYGENDIWRLRDEGASSGISGEDRARVLAELDVRITAALLSAGRDLSSGRMNAAALDRRWKAKRSPRDLVHTLGEAASGDVRAWLEQQRPHDPQYAALRNALRDLRAESDEENDPAVDRHIRQIRLNLERWRWMSDDLGERYLLVNVPAYRLMVRENGQSVLEMKVVVGKTDPAHRTPVLGSEMTTVVFSPYWNIPGTIASRETAPAAARDPDYLERNEIEVLRASKKGASAVDPSSIDWTDPSELHGLLLRQRPGARNALGHVKFVFPNPFDVYLHDTPSVRLFAKPVRALSHGCIRIEEPEKLARYVLSGQSEWTDERIASAMQSGTEHAVKLGAPLPVYIAYFTVWVGDDGQLNFYPDPYGYDAKQLKM
jgi:murein L,D-transpeptidase YcbB/YkuD